MADNPKGDRNLVRYEPNERVDLPDMKAMQDNGRSEARMLLHNFLFGHGGMGAPNPSGLDFAAVRDWGGAETDVQSNWTKGGMCSPFKVSAPIAGTTATIEAAWLDSLFATQTQGGALTGGYAGTALDSGEAEQGTACGTEGDDSQTISLSGKPAGTYGVYVTTVFDPATPGTRIFWNAATAQEDTQSMDTRKVAGWTASVALLSGGAPSDAHVLIATIDWDGAGVTNRDYAQNLMFEGLYLGSAWTGGSGWGDDGSVPIGYGHRGNNRLYNGVNCWQDWAAALRRQLKDIIGDPDGDGIHGWYTEIPVFAGTGGAAAWAGQYCDLSKTRDHIDDSSDPHGATLDQTNLNVNGTFDVEATATACRIKPNSDVEILSSSGGDILLAGSPAGQRIIHQGSTLTGGWIDSATHGARWRDTAGARGYADKILTPAFLFEHMALNSNEMPYQAGGAVPNPRTAALQTPKSYVALFDSTLSAGYSMPDIIQMWPETIQTGTLLLDSANSYYDILIDLSEIFSFWNTSSYGENTLQTVELWTRDRRGDLPAALQAYSGSNFPAQISIHDRAFNDHSFGSVYVDQLRWNEIPTSYDPASTVDDFVVIRFESIGRPLGGRAGSVLAEIPPTQSMFRLRQWTGESATGDLYGSLRIFYIRFIFECGHPTGG